MLTYDDSNDELVLIIQTSQIFLPGTFYTTTTGSQIKDLLSNDQETKA